jgi:hypothetical protein
VSGSDDFKKYALECVRLAAQCRDQAAVASTPGLRAHFLHMAGKWEELAGGSAAYWDEILRGRHRGSPRSS